MPYALPASKATALKYIEYTKPTFTPMQKYNSVKQIQRDKMSLQH